MNANVGDRDTEIPVGIALAGTSIAHALRVDLTGRQRGANFLSYVTLRMEPRGANPHPKFIEHLKD